jgi:hypothetical protein
MSKNASQKNFWQWFVEKALVPVLVALISVFGTYYITNLKNQQPVPITGDVPIESFAQDVFSFAGYNNNNQGGWGTLTLAYEKDRLPVYNFAYGLPTDANVNGYAGMTFRFKSAQDLTPYRAVSFSLAFDTPNDKVDFVVKDIAGKESRYQVLGNQQPKLTVVVNFSDLSGVNLKAVQEMLLLVDTTMLRGDHNLSLSNLHLLH